MNKSFFHLAPNKSLNHGECKSSVHSSVDLVNVLQRLSPWYKIICRCVSKYLLNLPACVYYMFARFTHTHVINDLSMLHCS